MSRMRIGSIGMVLLTVLLCAGLAVAQPRGRRQGPPGGRGPGGRGPMMGGALSGPVGLLMNEKVREELDLSEDQVSQLREAMREMMAGQREQFEALRELEPEQRREKFQELAEKLRKKVDEKLGEVLSDSQLTRLKEIELQLAVRTQGFRVLMRPEIVEALGITDEQQEKLRQLNDTMREKMRGVFEDVRDLEPEQRREKIREAMQKLRQEAQEEVENLLSEEQEETLQKMMGEPVELDLQRPQRRGPGGPRGQRGRGGRRGGGPRER